MTSEQLDLLTVLEQEQANTEQVARRRAGDFTWTTGAAGDAACTRCRHAGTIPTLRIKCRIHDPLPDDPACQAQFVTANSVRYYATRVAAGKSPRHFLDDAIASARDRRVDVDSILANIAQETAA